LEFRTAAVSFTVGEVCYPFGRSMGGTGQ